MYYWFVGLVLKVAALALDGPNEHRRDIQRAGERSTAPRNPNAPGLPNLNSTSE